MLGLAWLMGCDGPSASASKRSMAQSGAADGGEQERPQPESDAEVPSDASGEDSLAVRIDSSSASVCPGTCASLSVRVDDAVPTEAHVLSWADAADASEPSREVCPTRSTTYHVDVREQTDTAAELGSPARSGSADVTLTVRSDCEDAGAPSRPDDQGCSYRIPIAYPNKGIVSLSGIVKQDARENLYLAAGYTGNVTIAGQHFGHDTLFDTGNYDVLIAKFDSTCKLLWVRELESDGQFTTLYNFDVAPDGSMALITWDMSYDLFFNQETHQHVYVFDPKGDPKWDLLGGGFAPHAPQALDFGPDGALAVQGVDACAGVDGYGACVGVLNADGTTRHGVRVDGYSLGVAFDPQGRLVIAGLAGVNGNAFSFAGEGYDPGGPVAYAGLIESSGVTRWFRDTPASSDQLSSIEARAIFTANGDVLSPRMYVDPEGQHLHVWRVDPQGSTSQDADYVQPESAGWIQSLWPLADGTYAVTATKPVANTTTPGDSFEQQVLLQQRTAAGQVLHERDVSQGKYSAPGVAVPGPTGALGFTVIEMQEYNEVSAERGRTTALVVMRVEL